MMRAVSWRGFAALLACLLAACSSTPKPSPPTPLEEIAQPVAGSQMWMTQVGSRILSLQVAVGAPVVVATTDSGSVVALDAATGAQAWSGSFGETLTAGAGSDGRYSAAVTRGGDLVVLDRGQFLWRRGLPGQVVTPPLVAGERVFVQGLDRVVRAFDVLDGRPLWTQQRPGDALALTENGVLLPFKDTLVTAFGSRLTGLNPLTGEIRFDVAMASPRGTNEIERLADLVAPAARVGDTVCARAFQSAVSCANAERGALLWTRAVAGTTGLAANANVVVGADTSDRITAWKLGNGDTAWASDKLRYRMLSAPAFAGGYVVFDDLEGLLHFLSADKGETRLRLATDGSPAAAGPVAVGNTVIVATRSGAVLAVRAQ